MRRTPCFAALVPVVLSLAAGVATAQSKSQPTDNTPRQEQPSKQTGPRIDLRPRFKVGQEIHFKMSMTSSGKQTAPAATPGEKPTESAQSMSQEIGLTLKVKETNKETGSTLDLVYDSFKINMKTPDGQDVTFDSNAKKSDDPMADILGPLIGLTLTLKMDKDGNITTVNSGGGAGDISSLLGGASGLSSFTGADVVKNLFGPVMTTRKGAGEARVGESWTNEDLIDAPYGKMKLSTTQTLSSVRGGIATIDLKGRFDLMPSSSTSPIPGIKDSSYYGKTLWNTELGILDEMTMKQHIAVDEGKSNGKSVNDLNVTVKRTTGGSERGPSAKSPR
jgi:hypothetical protein